MRAEERVTLVNTRIIRELIRLEQDFVVINVLIKLILYIYIYIYIYVKYIYMYMS